jgi:hypothetical protein
VWSCSARPVADTVITTNAIGARQRRGSWRLATVSTVLVSVGAAAAVGGAILWLGVPRPRDAARAGIAPVVHDRGAGLAFAGSF